MRLVIIIVVALLLLGGGGAGAYFYFQHPAEASVGETDEHQDAKEAEKGHGDEGEPAAAFVEMDPLILPIIGAKGATQTVSLVIVLEVADEAKAEEVKHLTPRLKDAYIQNMYGMLSRKNALQDGMIQVGPLKERLNKISKQVLGDDVVHDVLLQVVQQRPI